jgi:hypothetical protein
MHPSGATRRETAGVCPRSIPTWLFEMLKKNLDVMTLSQIGIRHCERSEAIQDYTGSLSLTLDCFASLAMTTKSDTAHQAQKYAQRAPPYPPGWSSCSACASSALARSPASPSRAFAVVRTCAARVGMRSISA